MLDYWNLFKWFIINSIKIQKYIRESSIKFTYIYNFKMAIKTLNW